MLPIGFMLKFGSAFRAARNARDPKKIALALGDVPESVIKSAARHGVVWRLDAHPVDCVEDPKLILVSLGACFIELAIPPADQTQKKLVNRLQIILDAPSDEVNEILELGKWLAGELGRPESKIYWLAKRLDELAGTNGFLDLMHLLKNSLGDSWNEDQIAGLNDVKRAFRIG